MNKEISSLKDHIMNLNENIQNNIQTITKLNEDNKCFRTIIFILFILLVFGFVYGYYKIHDIKNSLNSLSNDITYLEYSERKNVHRASFPWTLPWTLF